MTQPKSEREKAVRASVAAIFDLCENSKNPVLAYSRACSKIGYMARDGVRSELHYLESALNERKHALIAARCNQPDKVSDHNRDCGRDLGSFQRALRVELERPRPPPSTPELQARIHRNLDAGQWNRARTDLDELAVRADFNRPLPALDTFGRASNLNEQQFAALQGRIERCNALALERARTRGGQHTSAELGDPNGAKVLAPPHQRNLTRALTNNDRGIER